MSNVKTASTIVPAVEQTKATNFLTKSVDDLTYQIKRWLALLTGKDTKQQQQQQQISGSAGAIGAASAGSPAAALIGAATGSSFGAPASIRARGTEGGTVSSGPGAPASIVSRGTGGGGGGEANNIGLTPGAPGVTPGMIAQLPGDRSWGDYGTRANNPGNMNYASWQHASGRYAYTDPHNQGKHELAVYNTMQEGVADAVKLMERNQAKHGKTISGALSGWAENSYIGPLAKSIGMDPNAEFDIKTADKNLVAKLLAEQFRREGRKGSHTASTEQILGGIDLERSGGVAPTGGSTASAVSAVIPGGGSSGGGGATGTWEAPTTSKEVVDHLNNMKKAGLITNEQCVTLGMASVGVKYGSQMEGGHTSDWRRGDSAAEGGLKAGTPIATFLDRQGRTGNTYAIGGNGGQMGAGLDHAAVFENYIRDKTNKIIGMQVEEQYKGSHGQHLKNYMFGQGRGEHDASNYYAIKTRSGYLGGAANPMSGNADAIANAIPKRRSQDAQDDSTSRRPDPYGRDSRPGPLHMDNWQSVDRSPQVAISNQTGHDVFINSSLLAV
jgi:hypothetical protein